MLEAAGWKVCIGNTLGFGECGEPGLAWAGRHGGGWVEEIQGDYSGWWKDLEPFVLHPVWSSSQCVLSGRSGVLWGLTVPPTHAREDSSPACGQELVGSKSE